MLVRTLSDNKNPSFLDDNWKTQKHTRFVVCFVTALCIHAHKRRRRRRRRKTTNNMYIHKQSTANVVVPLQE